MNKLGIQSLNAGAPDLRLSGDQTQRGTYTQRRRTQMAGGGITNARQGYLLGGVTDFLGSVKDKIVDDLIPNEIKENPLLTAALVGGSTKFLPEGMGQGWLGDLLGKAEGIPVLGPIADVMQTTGTSITDLINKIPGVNLPGGTLGSGTLGRQDQEFTKGWEKEYLEPLIGTLGGLTQFEKAKQAYETLTGQRSSDYDAQGRPKIRWAEPLAIGTTIGAADYLTRSEDKMPPQLSVNIPQSGQEAFDDPNLRFKPKEQYVDTMAMAADGGRIGYDDGKSVINYNEDPEYRGWKKMYEQNPDVASMHDNHNTYLNFYNAQGQAQGGRIGYDNGGDVEEQLIEAVAKKFPNLNTDQWNLEDLITMLQISGTLDTEGANVLDKAAGIGMITPQSISRSAQAVSRHRDYIAQGGRIGAQEGGLMNLGGMEKDYRQEGGFVPIGGEEKADDVPARLSKNEFVFTADAVRAAGGGDIDEGAAVMERLMENLEAGGKVSEDSQGLEGAQEMFANTQRLQNRII